MEDFDGLIEQVKRIHQEKINNTAKFRKLKPEDLALIMQKVWKEKGNVPDVAADTVKKDSAKYAAEEIIQIPCKTAELVNKEKISKPLFSDEDVSDEDSYSYRFGSLWGIDDKKIRFDGKRKEFHTARRPCVVLKNTNISEKTFRVLVAPGSHLKNNNQLTLKVLPKDSGLKLTTYFIIKYRALHRASDLERKFDELSQDAKEDLKNILKKLHD